MSRITLLLFFALIMTCGGVLHAQWKMVAPHLFSSGGGTGRGAMHVKDGVIWAGVDSLWFSTDTGKTWQPSTLAVSISDINFFNTRIGVVAGSNGVYLTIDGGKTWRYILGGGNFTSYTSVAFGSSSSVIYALDGGRNDAINVTTDMGVTWRTLGFGGIDGGSIAVGTNGTLYVFSLQFSTMSGWINSSTDVGQTWSQNTGSVDADSYSLITDSCDVNKLYLANENYAFTNDYLSHIFTSTDAGATWQAGFTDAVDVISGDITASNLAEYAGTMDMTGVLRSLDRGQSWISIGGGNMQYDSIQGRGVLFDSRDIVAFDDNTVLTIDPFGNIWATYNSGGYPVPPLVISPRELFINDTANCDSINRLLSLTPAGCKPDSIFSTWLIGPDSISYQVGAFNNNSVPVTFLPAHFGAYSASLVFKLSNYIFDTISLSGYSIGERPLNFLTADAITDTIGATVSVPITITGLTRPENVDLILHYDTTLQYQGSFDPSNVNLDIAGQQWPGRSKLNIASAQSGVIAGYARFNVFADSGAKSQVTFDSLDVLSASSPCEYTLPSAVTSTITAPSGCGAIILSEFLKDGQIPTFTIRPNPTMSDVTITSSLDLGDAEVEIYDMLGREWGNVTLLLAKNSPVNISMPESAGIYYLRVKSVAGVGNLSVIVAK